MLTKPYILCLMGPTAAGKTPLAVQLVQRLPCDIISVDSAMVYRGLDIGTAKPGPDILQVAPHRLIDIRDPAEAYSAGEFQRDVLQEIAAIHAQGRIPLLVGGTMLYFGVLQQGLAQMPVADPLLRIESQQEAEKIGWEGLHARLASVDPEAAKRIHPHDSQRIQRALEVYLQAGQPLTTYWQQSATQLSTLCPIYYLAIAPAERRVLHKRIEDRFYRMLALGFVAEVQRLFERGDLSIEQPAIRCVGYRQMWEYFLGEVDYTTMRDKAIAATRQLAKRQLTWLRSWPNVVWFDGEAPDLLDKVLYFCSAPS